MKNTTQPSETSCITRNIQAMSQMTPMQIDGALKGMTRSQIGEILASVMPDLFAPTEACMCSTETLERIRAVFQRKNTARGFSSSE